MAKKNLHPFLDVTANIVTKEVEEQAGYSMTVLLG